jgi:hypothetical protein
MNIQWNSVKKKSFLVLYVVFMQITNNTGVQSINNVFHIVDKVENVCVNKYIFDLIDNVEYVVYALYSRILLGKIPIIRFLL